MVEDSARCVIATLTIYCLNPYSFGRWSKTLKIHDLFAYNATVLILILLEDGRRQKGEEIDGNLFPES